MSNGGDELFEIFVKELEEHLQVLESSLLEIEKDFDNPEEELINNVLRACHSMKGASGFFGYDHIGKVSHAMESVFEKVRDDELKPDNAFMGIMLDAVDKLKEVTEDLESGKQEDFFEQIERISTYMTSGDTSPLETVEVTRPDTGFIEFDIQPEIAQEAARFGKSMFSVLINVQDDLFARGRKPAEVLGELETLGDIIDADPGPEQISKLRKNSKQKQINLLVSTVLDQDLLIATLEIPDTQVQIINLEQYIPAEVPQEVSAASDDSENESVAITGAVKRESGSYRRKGALRVRTDLLDDLMKIAGELVLERNQLLETFSNTTESRESLNTIIQNVNRITTDLQNKVIKTRMQPLDVVFRKFPRMVRDIARDLGKRIELQVEGEDVELDSSIIENISDPLLHLIRNACDHGLEMPTLRREQGKPAEGVLRLTAYYDGEQVNIDIVDDGRGMDPERIAAKAIERGLATEEEIKTLSRTEILSFVFRPGFSTADKVSSLSGRGVGMDVVASNVNKLGGSVIIDSVVGQGTHISMRLPLTLAIIPTLIAKVEEQNFAILQTDIEELLLYKGEDAEKTIGKVRGVPVLMQRDELIPLIRLADVLGLQRTFTHPETGERLPDRRELIADRRAEELIVDENGKVIGTEEQPEYPQRSGLDRRDAVKFLIVILRYHDKNFGLIVDGKENIEEMVVKPLPRYVKSCAHYSGASIRGNGRVILILDINGIAQLAGLRFGDTEKLEKLEFERRRSEKREISESMELLMLRVASGEYVGLALDMIQRVQEISRSDIETVGDKHYVQHEGRSLRVLKLEHYIPAQDTERAALTQFLVIPRMEKPLGFIVSDVVDTQNAVVEIDLDNIKDRNLFGSAIINEKTVLFPDIYSIFDEADQDRLKQQPPALGKKRRILLVEDTQYWREILLRYLEKTQCSVTCTDSGRGALELIDKEPFDIVLSDLILPDCSGYDLLDDIRSHAQGENIPVIGITTLGHKGAIAEALKAGFNKCVVKAHRDVLLHAITELIG